MKTTGCHACAQTLFAARTKQIETHVHERSDGRFAVAKWDDRAARWRWCEKPAPKHVQGYCFSFSRTLDGVTRTYARRSSAIASLPELRSADHPCDACFVALQSEFLSHDETVWDFELAVREDMERAESKRLEEEREAQERAYETEDPYDCEQAAVAEAQTAIDRETSRFWSNAVVGMTLSSAKDLVVVEVDPKERRLVAVSPKGERRAYGAFASETGSVHLFRQA